MGRVKHFVLAVASVFLSFGIYARVPQSPPEPTKQTSDARKGPCGELPENSNGIPPPPPPGLCLPINDYLVPLLLVGILFGTWKVWVLEKKEETSDSPKN